MYYVLSVDDGVSWVVVLDDEGCIVVIEKSVKKFPMRVYDEFNILLGKS